MRTLNVVANRRLPQPRNPSRLTWTADGPRARGYHRDYDPSAARDYDPGVDPSQDRRAVVAALVVVLVALFVGWMESDGPLADRPDGPVEAHVAAFSRLVEATTPPASVMSDETDVRLRAWCRDAQPRLHSLVDDDFLDPPDRELARLSAVWLRAAENYLSRCTEGIFTNGTVRPLNGLEDVIGYHEDRLLESDQG